MIIPRRDDLHSFRVLSLVRHCSPALVGICWCEKCGQKQSDVGKRSNLHKQLFTCLEKSEKATDIPQFRTSTTENKNQQDSTAWCHFKLHGFTLYINFPIRDLLPLAKIESSVLHVGGIFLLRGTPKILGQFIGLYRVSASLEKIVKKTCPIPEIFSFNILPSDWLSL